MTIFDAATRYAAERVPLVVIAGKEYGSGSSRDWAAKGTALLGVRAVIAESFERIHRSNLIGMGVLPLQFPPGADAASLGLSGEETFTIHGLAGQASPPRSLTVTAEGRRRPRVQCHRPHRHPGRGGLLPPRRHPAIRAAQPRYPVTPARAVPPQPESPQSASAGGACAGGAQSSCPCGCGQLDGSLRRSTEDWSASRACT